MWVKMEKTLTGENQLLYEKMDTTHPNIHYIEERQTLTTTNLKEKEEII